MASSSEPPQGPLAGLLVVSLEQAVAEAEALARQARLEAERAEKLFAKRSITEQRLQSALTDRDVAAARLRSTELQVEKSRLAAPWGGRIAAKRAEVGDYVTPGQPIAELIDVSRIKVRAPAPAADAPFLEVGLPVTVFIVSTSRAWTPTASEARSSVPEKARLPARLCTERSVARTPVSMRG